MPFPLLACLAVASLASAHFILQWPPTAGFDDNAEPNGPCGGQTVMISSSSPQIQVSQFAVSIMNTHPVGEWMIRGTTDTQAPYNFTDLVPILNTTGVGAFCLPNMKAPSDFAGKGGVVQVVDRSADGVLYQCAPVNWVSGSNSTTGPACTNATGFGAQFTSLQDFVSGQGNMSNTPSGTSSMASGTASAAASQSSHAGAAMVTGLGGLAGAIGLLAAGLA